MASRCAGQTTDAQPVEVDQERPHLLLLNRGVRGGCAWKQKGAVMSWWPNGGEVPSLISVNMAVSVAVEQERRRQDGRAAAAAGLEAASSPCAPARLSLGSAYTHAALLCGSFIQ